MCTLVGTGLKCRAMIFVFSLLRSVVSATFISGHLPMMSLVSGQSCSPTEETRMGLTLLMTLLMKSINLVRPSSDGNLCNKVQA